MKDSRKISEIKNLLLYNKLNKLIVFFIKT